MRLETGSGNLDLISPVPIDAGQNKLNPILQHIRDDTFANGLSSGFKIGVRDIDERGRLAWG